MPVDFKPVVSLHLLVCQLVWIPNRDILLLVKYSAWEYVSCEDTLRQLLSKRHFLGALLYIYKGTKIEAASANTQAQKHETAKVCGKKVHSLFDPSSPYPKQSCWSPVSFPPWLCFVCSLLFLTNMHKSINLSTDSTRAQTRTALSCDKDTASPPTHLCTDSSIHLVFNKETSGSVQSDAADRPTDFQIDNTHTYTAGPAPLVDYITVILTMASTQSFCWLWFHTGVRVCVWMRCFIYLFLVLES